jgi:hypothetical protein
VFGFLKRKPSESESITYCKALGAAAVIEPVLEQGLHVGFLIRVDETGASLAPYFQYDAARSAFVHVVEDRVESNDFEQMVPNRSTLGLPPLADDGRQRAVRVVLGRNDTSLMQWNT